LADRSSIDALFQTKMAGKPYSMRASENVPGLQLAGLHEALPSPGSVLLRLDAESSRCLPAAVATRLDCRFRGNDSAWEIARVWRVTPSIDAPFRTKMAGKPYFMRGSEIDSG
jgi:hypothetical protein